MNEERTIDFKPFARQYEALELLMDNKTNEILYGGGARGGKSYLGNAWVIMSALSMPGSTWLVARKRFSDLRDTTLITFNEVLNNFGISGAVNYNAQEKRATFSNGSIVFFKDIDYEPSDPLYNRLGSYNLTGAFLDEAQEINKQALNILRGRFSNLVGDGWKTIPKSFYSCNPDKSWVYYDFYKPFVNGELPEDKAFVPALATDNPHIDEEYIKNLSKADEVTVQRLLYGNFEYDNSPNTMIPFDRISDLWTNTINDTGVRYITADIARYGKDKTVIMYWRGLTLKKTCVIDTSSLVIVKEKIQEMAREYKVPYSHIIVDEDGVGGGVVDMMGGIKGFMSNKRPLDIVDMGRLVPANYLNLKTQMYYKLAELINFHKIAVEDESIKDKLSEELAILRRKDVDKEGKLKIETKEEQKQLLGRSPDYMDAMMMRMWYEYRPQEHYQEYAPVIDMTSFRAK